MLESYMFKSFLRFRLSLCLLFFLSFKKIDERSIYQRLFVAMLLYVYEPALFAQFLCPSFSFI